MKGQPRIIAFLFLLSLGLLISCGKDNDTGPSTDDSEAGSISGMGDSNGELKGTAFHFPDAIEIKGGIVGGSDLGEGYCKTVGSGLPVMLEFSFVSHLDKDTVLVFPGGLTFRSNDLEDQNGILLQDVSIALAKGDSCKTLMLTYCINADRHASSETSSYAFGPITNAKPMVELINLLKNKVINIDTTGEGWLAEGFMDAAINLQEAVWNVTDWDGLTQADRDYIKSLPSK